MLPVIPAAILVTTLATAQGSATLPRGDGHFRLGMFRAQVDSAVSARGLAILSSGSTFLVCSSEDPAIEYELYSFFQAPHDIQLLWKVTVGYRLDASPDVLEQVRADLGSRLGDPASDTGMPAQRATGSRHGNPLERRIVWADASTAVRLGGRWREEPDPRADRMLVTWTDRRLQRLVEARRKQDRSQRQR